MWFVYMIKTNDGKLYTGITVDLQRRLEEHRLGKKGARYFSFSRPEAFVYTETQPNRSEASKRESAIKKMNRHQKLALIKQSDQTNTT